MTKMADFEREIIRDWKALPETERQTVDQASWFADKIVGRYPFDNQERPYRVILGSICEYQYRIGKPLIFR